MSPPFHVRDVPGARRGVVLLHGVMSHAGWFEAFTEALARRKISSVAVDRRGSGTAKDMESAVEPRVWLEDIRVAQAHLRDRGAQVSLLGWCWGARLAIVSASIDPPDRLLLVAPGLAMSASIRSRAAALATGSEDPVALPFGAELFSSKPEVLRWIADDALAWRTQPRSFLPSSRGLLDRSLSVLPALTLPIATILADGDRIVDNSAVEKLVGAHEIVRLPGEHALVLEAPEVLAETVAALVAP